MKKLFVLILVALTYNKSYACVTCNQQLQKAIYNSTFYPNLFTMLIAFMVLAALVFSLYWINVKKHKTAILKYPGVTILDSVPLSTASTVLGIGIGGFIDGIVFHQILQWHEMLSNKIPPVNLLAKSVNMFWDGIFHGFCLLVVIAGIIMLFKTLGRTNINRSTGLLSGGLLTGWALFNIIEGVIDHHILKLHNVREITTSINAWNFGFLAVSLVMLLIGLMFINREFKPQHV